MSTGEPPLTRDEQITALYKSARYYSTTPNISVDETIEEKDRSTEAQRKRVYRWLLNHARNGQVDLLEKFLQAPEATRKHVLALKDEYVRKDQTNNPDKSKDVFEKNGFSIMHVAALFGQPAVVEKVLPNGEDKFGFLMERTHPYGWLALHLCTWPTVRNPAAGGAAEEEVLKLLLKAYFKEHQDLDRSSKMEKSTLLLRFKGAFHDNIACMTPLHYATRALNYKVVKLLLSDKYLRTITYVHSVDLFLLTPLHIIGLAFKEKEISSSSRSKDALIIAKLLIHAAKRLPDLSMHTSGTAEKQSEGDAAVEDSARDVEKVSMLDICINAVDCCFFTPLHWAADSDASEIVKLLLAEDKVKPLEKDRGRKTPLHVAMGSFNSGLNHHSASSKKLLMAHKTVSEDVERRLKDRQISVDSSNATLVGASLIASITFTSLLQPPLGWITYYDSTYRDSPPDSYRVYAGVGKDAWIEAFWILDCLSFLLAACTIISCSLAVRPKSRVHVIDMVLATKRWLLVTSCMFTLSLFFVLGAFVVAGFAALPPPLLLKVESFIAPGSLPLLLGLGLCGLCVYDLRHVKKLWRSFHAGGKEVGTRIRRVITTVDQRKENKGLERAVKLLTYSSDRLEIARIMQEIESLRSSYHKGQSYEDCRKEALDVGADALLKIQKVFQSPSDKWNQEAFHEIDNDDPKDSKIETPVNRFMEKLRSMTDR
ncbi:hypothetical protein R1flu_004470 [Riccia fluitans]|uniref:PGG domain-containing protein n=1 Tax=Riccia fluitans TaxID=41844 RepID=A0ABD1YQW6_9MARC